MGPEAGYGLRVSDQPIRPVRVTFVCTGNVVRSPVAAALLRRHLDGLPVEVDSRGVVDIGPVPADAAAILAAYELGVDVRAHRARSFERGELSDVDLVVGFEPRHISAAVVDGGAQLGRTFTVTELAGLLELQHAGGSFADVIARAAARRRNPLSSPALADPVGAGAAEIARTIRTIDGLVATIARVLLPPLAARS